MVRGPQPLEHQPGQESASMRSSSSGCRASPGSSSINPSRTLAKNTHREDRIVWIESAGQQIGIDVKDVPINHAVRVEIDVEGIVIRARTAKASLDRERLHLVNALSHPHAAV